jgi:uncharacterized protein YecT (DUF1311 family)
MKYAAALLISVFVGAAPAVAGRPAVTGPHESDLTMETVVDIDSVLTPAYVACMHSGDAKNGVTYALINCKQDEFSRQDEKLNKIYKAMLAEKDKDPEDRVRLTTIQRKWITARDAMCDSESEDAGEGTLSAVVHVDCMLRYTAKRAVELKQMDEIGY